MLLQLCVSTTPLLLHGVTTMHMFAHKALVAKVALRYSGFVELSHPPYSPDPFPSLKEHLCGMHFKDNNELKKSGYRSKTKHFMSVT